VRSLENRKCHDGLIQRLVDDLREKGYQDIRVDHLPEFEDRRPERLYSSAAEFFFTPDVTATRQGRECLFEVETEDSLCFALTQEELRTFSVIARERGSLVYLVVPSHLDAEARALLEGLENKNHRQTFVLPMAV